MDVFLTAFDNIAADRQADNKAPPDKWVRLRLRIEGVEEFKICEGPQISYGQPDDHLEILWIGKLVYLVFDPLQSKNFEKHEWSLDEIRSSEYYVGGHSCYWHIYGFETEKQA